MPTLDITARKWKSILRTKIFPNYRVHLPTLNGSCARLRLWRKDLAAREQQIKQLKSLKEDIDKIAATCSVLSTRSGSPNFDLVWTRGRLPFQITPSSPFPITIDSCVTIIIEAYRLGHAHSPSIHCNNQCQSYVSGTFIMPFESHFSPFIIPYSYCPTALSLAVPPETET